MCRPRPAVSSTKSLLQTKSGKSRQPRGAPRSGGEAAPHRCPALGRPSASRGENLQQNSHQKKRDRERKEVSWSEEQVEPEQAAAGLVLALRGRQPQEPGSVSEVRTGGFRPLGSFQGNRRPRVSLQTLQTWTIPGSGPPQSPRPPGTPYSLCGDGS